MAQGIHQDPGLCDGLAGDAPGNHPRVCACVTPSLFTRVQICLRIVPHVSWTGMSPCFSPGSLTLAGTTRRCDSALALFAVLTILCALAGGF